MDLSVWPRWIYQSDQGGFVSLTKVDFHLFSLTKVDLSVWPRWICQSGQGGLAEVNKHSASKLNTVIRVM